MTLVQLQYFVAVADTGSISAASRFTGISQPTLSEQIQRLESIDYGLGCRLFDRKSRSGCSLTPAGSALLVHARVVLETVAKARLAVSQAA